MGKQWKQWQTFIFWGSKITAYGDCSHEIKRRLLLGRKAMTNIDSILESRDISFLTKICQIKAMVFPVVMYECENWTIKKAEYWRTDAFDSVVLEKACESPLGCKELKPVYLKGNQPWIFIGRTDAEAEAPILWIGRGDSFEKTLMLGKIEGRRKRRGQQKMRWLDSITDSMDTILSRFQNIVKDREAWHAALHGVAKIQTWLNNNHHHYHHYL